MCFHTEIEVEISTDIVEALIVVTINSRRQIQGDVFATADEAEILKEDPLASIDLVRQQLCDLASKRFHSGDATLLDWGVWGRRVCFTYRITSARVEELARAGVAIYAPALIAQASKKGTSHRDKIILRQTLMKQICGYVKAQLRMPSENRLGSADEERIRDIIGPTWAAAVSTNGK